jgi:hypothetical protein
MTFRVSIMLACLAGAQVLSGQSAPRRPPAAAPAAASRAEVRVPFRAGELLTYDVSYSTYVTAGTVTMQVQAKRPSYNSVKTAIAQTQGKCALTPPGWSHTTGINGAKVAFGYLGRPKGWSNRLWRFHVSLQEDATYKAAVVRVAPGRVTAKTKKAITKTLANLRSRPLLGHKGNALAYKSTLVALPKQRLKRAGWYVYGIRLAAAMNPQRTYLALSRPFRVKGR